MVVCLERDADLHMAKLMPLPLSVSCFSKIQVGSTFLVPAHPGKNGKGSPYSITERRVPELIPVLGSQPAGDVCHKPGYHYFPPDPQLPSQPLRGLLPILLLGEQRHDGCEQFA